MIRALPEVFRTTRLVAQRVEERHLADLARHYAGPAAAECLVAPHVSGAPTVERAMDDRPTGHRPTEPAALEETGDWAEWLASSAAPHWQEHGYGLFALYEKQTGEAGATRPFAGLAGLRAADPYGGSLAEDGSRGQTDEHSASSVAGMSAASSGAPPHSRVVELVFALVPEAAGRGYATEIGGALTGLALTSLDRESVIAVVRPDNSRALHVLEKLGFTKDREHVRHGVPHVLFRRRR